MTFKHSGFGFRNQVCLKNQMIYKNCFSFISKTGAVVEKSKQHKVRQVN